ncbi:MAG: TIR domain-containing protein [Acidobacteriota bacterium]
MAHDVFISYSSRNKTTADAVCAKLEERHIRCWIAPRDILPGSAYGASIVRAIGESRAMILVFSADSNISPHVTREVERAVGKAIPILPFRIDTVVPTDDMEYFLSATHWLDAMTPPLEAHLQRLAEVVEVLLQHSASTSSASGDVPIQAPPQAAIEKAGDKPNTLTTYLNRIREECGQTFSSELVRPDRVYVPQFASPFGDPAAEANLSDVMKEFWTNRGRRVAVLGNYGMGKTYFTWRTTLDQTDRCDNEREATIPILFPLKKFNYTASAEQEQKKKDLVDQVMEHAIYFDFPRVDRQQFVRWIEDGVVGIILDGLDELLIPRTKTWTEVVQPLLDLERAGFVITSRTSYIQTFDKELAPYSVFELLAWGAREWHQYLECSKEALAAAGGKDLLLNAVANRSNLATLTTRPLWCYMIVSIADEIPKLRDLQLSGLYQQFLDRAVKRRPLMDSLLTLAWQYCAMERFAEECARKQESSLDESQLLTILSRLFEAIGHKELKEFLTKQVRTYAFLNCDRDKKYNFGHKSFQDYFTATGIGRWMAEQSAGYQSGPPEFTTRDPFIGERPLSDEQAVFLAGVLQEAWILESLEIVPPSEGRKLHSKILLFLQKELSTDEASQIARTNLFRVYLSLVRGSDKEDQPFLNGFCLKSANLAEADLSNCTFQKVDFSDALLSRASFRGSSLGGCTFFGATIDGADFTDADLTGADLVGVEKPNLPPVFANSKGVDRARMTAREKSYLFP